MHEMSLMASVFNVINENIASYPDAKVTKVNLVVGAMTNAVPDALQFAFEVLSKGTAAEGAELDIKEVPLTLECNECGFKGEVDKHQFICPDCQSWQVEAVAGRELLIKSLEVETNGD